MNKLFILFLSLSLLFSGLNAQEKAGEKGKTATKEKTAEKPKSSEKKADKKDKEPNKHGHKPDGRTKTGDPVDHSKKGPKGETVYKGERGGKYYLDGSNNKVYIK